MKSKGLFKEDAFELEAKEQYNSGEYDQVKRESAERKQHEQTNGDLKVQYSIWEVQGMVNALEEGQKGIVSRRNRRGC